ncbi:hypothetical protein AX14_005669 [Amanita brunnescens Koide BX004]|nr:hypothetical protein AX14_005669 [Amanita brunnescens Koide BX004]
MPATYGAAQVMIQDLSPSKSALGAMYGLAQAVASVSRGLSPSVASSLYAISLQRHLAGGNAYPAFFHAAKTAPPALEAQIGQRAVGWKCFVLFKHGVDIAIDKIGS